MTIRVYFSTRSTKMKTVGSHATLNLPIIIVGSMR